VFRICQGRNCRNASSKATPAARNCGTATQDHAVLIKSIHSYSFFLHFNRNDYILNIKKKKLFSDVVESLVNDELATVGAQEIQSAMRQKAEALRTALASQLLESTLNDVAASESRLVSINVAEDAIDQR